MIIIINIDLVKTSNTSLNQKKIFRHQQDIEDGKELFPIDVRKNSDFYQIDGNGRHRYHAYKNLGFTQIPVKVK